MTVHHASQAPESFKNKIDNVAIVGAGGQVGSYISQALVAQGKHRVIAITRANSKASLPDGIHKQNVDYDSHESLVSALQGQDFLIISMSVFAPRDTQDKLIKAAKDAGVKWIMPSEYGSDLASREDVGRDTKLGPPALAIRKAIVDAGMNFVALSCSFWYEFSLAGGEARYGFDFDRRTVTLYDEGETRITTSTWPQCGRAVAALLSLPILPEDESDKSFTISRFRNVGLCISSFYVSQKDMLASILRVTKTEERDWTITHEDVKTRFERGNKMFAKGDFMGFGIALYARLFYSDGAGNLQAKLVNQLLGLPEEDLDEATRIAINMSKTLPKH